MATKSKLEQAVESNAANLNAAQRELVMSQFSVYKQNAARIAQISMQLETLNTEQATTLQEVREKQSARASLAYEHGQLSTANSKIATELFGLLKED